jgi:hypothetical protein
MEIGFGILAECGGGRFVALAAYSTRLVSPATRPGRPCSVARPSPSDGGSPGRPATSRSHATPTTDWPPCGHSCDARISVAAERLLQVVVRPWQIRRVVAREQPRPVTPAHLEEVAHTRGQRTRRRPVSTHHADHLAPLTTDLLRRTLVPTQEVTRLMHPAEGHRDRRLHQRRRHQASRDQPVQPSQFG